MSYVGGRAPAHPNSMGGAPAPQGGDDDDMYTFAADVNQNSMRTAMGKQQPVVIQQQQGAPYGQAPYGGQQGAPYGAMGAAGYGAGGMGGPAGSVYRRQQGTAMGSRMGTAARGGGGGEVARPMTSNKSAGFPGTAAGGRGRSGSGNAPFDPLNQGAGARGPAPILEKKQDDSPEDQARAMEKVVNKLVEDSAMANMRGDYRVALEKAKEAGQRERALCRHREANGMEDQINIDLTYSVCFNLANQYHANQMYSEANNTYSLIVKDKRYAQAGRLRVNMGNIFYEQKKYGQAIKMYRMALDQIPHTGKEIRFKIMRNIGNAFVRMRQYQDAIGSFEAIMEGSTPDFQTGFNILVCYNAVGDREQIKQAYQNLLSVKPVGASNDDDSLDNHALLGSGMENLMVAPTDDLKETLKEREKQAHNYILMASKLIVDGVEADVFSGYDYVIDSLKSSPYEMIAAEMEIAKAIAYLKARDFDKAIVTLKEFEKKDHALLAVAATNLSFVYFVQSDMENAEKYADIAVQADRYNASALVNKGNCAFARTDLELAKDLYKQAISVEADCVEAMYNLGLVYKRQDNSTLALQSFEKVHTIIPNTQEVLYQIADAYSKEGNVRDCTKYLNYVVGKVPSDPGVLQRLAQLYDKEDDESQAFHWNLEAYRYYPVDIEVIAWLGAYFVRGELYEKALQYFERAASIEPKVPKWKLMVASCLRRIGLFKEAFDTYVAIHEQFPTNTECLKYLVQLCKNVHLGLADKAEEYQLKLEKLERVQSQAANFKEKLHESMDENRRPAAGAKNGGDDALSRESNAVDASGPAEPEFQMAKGPHVDSSMLNKKSGKKVRTGQKVDDDWGDDHLDALLP